MQRRLQRRFSVFLAALVPTILFRQHTTGFSASRLEAKKALKLAPLSRASCTFSASLFTTESFPTRSSSQRNFIRDRLHAQSSSILSSGQNVGVPRDEYDQFDVFTRRMSEPSIGRHEAAQLIQENKEKRGASRRKNLQDERKSDLPSDPSQDLLEFSTKPNAPLQLVQHPSELLAKLMMEGFDLEVLNRFDPRQLETSQLEMLIESLTRNEENWRMGGELLKWLVSWGILAPEYLYLRVLVSYAEHANLNEAILFLQSLRRPHQTTQVSEKAEEREHKVPAAAYHTILKLATQERNWDAMKAVWEIILEDKIELSLHNYTLVIVAHTRAGDWVGAVKVFKTMWKLGISPDAVAYSALLQALRQGKQYDLIDHTLQNMRTAGIKPNSRAHAVVLDSLLDRKKWREGVQYYYNLRLESNGDLVSNYAHISLIRTLGRAGKIQLAEQIFSEAPKDDPQILSAMLSAYKSQADGIKAAALLQTMLDNKVEVRTLEGNLALSALLKTRNSTATAWSIFSRMRSCALNKMHLQKHGITTETLWSMVSDKYALVSEPGLAFAEFSASADKISYEIMQHVFAREGEIELVEALSNEMQLLGYDYSSYALCARMKALLAHGDWRGMFSLFREAKSHPESSKLLSVHAYNLALISLLRQERYDTALLLCGEMKKERIKPNSHTFELVTMLRQAGTKEVDQEISRMQAFSAAAAAAGLVLWHGIL